MNGTVTIRSSVAPLVGISNHATSRGVDTAVRVEKSNCLSLVEKPAYRYWIRIFLIPRIQERSLLCALHLAVYAPRVNSTAIRTNVRLSSKCALHLVVFCEMGKDGLKTLMPSGISLKFHTKALELKVVTDGPFNDNQRWIELLIRRAETGIARFIPEVTKSGSANSSPSGATTSSPHTVAPEEGRCSRVRRHARALEVVQRRGFLDFICGWCLIESSLKRGERRSRIWR
jgi:hypothetical protein